MELNELYQSFNIFLYIGIFTEGFFWRTQEYIWSMRKLIGWKRPWSLDYKRKGKTTGE